MSSGSLIHSTVPYEPRKCVPKSALLLKKDFAEGVIDGRLLGDVRKMKCTSKVGKTVFIAKAGTKTRAAACQRILVL